MNLYRATYRKPDATVRRMTFAHAGGIKAAHRHAQAWELKDDRLQRVDWLRDCERPVFNLTSEGAV